MQGAELLALLAPGQSLSGAALAKTRGVTRAAIWKQIQALRERGVPIESHGAAGYRLPWPIQLLDAAKITAHRQTQQGELALHWELDSTSSELQRRSASGVDLCVVMAETQTAGRGRRGRQWLSPPGLNIYLSCGKRFDAGFATLSGLSLAVGVMVLHALTALGVSGAGLKWPNDVLTPCGKLGGVLVELGGEFSGPCTAIIGVGLNLRITRALAAQAAQPVDDLAALCGGAAPDRNRVAAALIDALIDGLTRFEREGFAGFTADYARHDLLLDQPLQLTGAHDDVHGHGAGVDARGALRLRLADGSQRLIDSAEVTVRQA